MDGKAERPLDLLALMVARGRARHGEHPLEQAGHGDAKVIIRMTGCPNGCARPYLAEIGLVGRQPGLYNLYLGAAFDGKYVYFAPYKNGAGDANPHGNVVRFDTTAAFADKASWQALDLATVQSNGYSFQIEMTHKLWRQGYKVVEVPIIFTDRRLGSSKISKTEVLRSMVTPYCRFEVCHFWEYIKNSWNHCRNCVAGF